MWRIALKPLSVRRILLSVMFFLIIFNPPFLPRFSFTMGFTVIAILYCSLYNKSAAHLINSPYLKRWIGLFIIFYSYYFVVSAISYFGKVYNTNPLSTFVGSLVDVVSLFFVSLFLCMIVFRKGEDFDTLVEYIINAGVIEAFFGVAAFVSPGVKRFLNGITIANSRSEKIVHAVGTATFRNYGIASTLFDSFGFAMSLMALLALYKALNGKPKYYVYFVAIAFTASINARTSMVLIAVGATIIIFGKNADTLKSIGRKSLIVFVAFFILCFASYYLDRGGANAQWLSSGIEEIKTLITGGQTTGTFIILFREICFPDDILETLFGIGLTPAQAIRRTVDMGYIQNLWMFGVVGSILLYAFYSNPIRIWAKKIKTDRILAFAIAVVIFVFFIKLNLFGYGISTVVLITLYMGRLISLPREELGYNVVVD